MAGNNNRKNCLHLPLYVFAFAISGAVHFYWMNERECELKDLDADRSLMNTRAIELLSGHFGVAAGLFHCVLNRAFIYPSICFAIELWAKSEIHVEPLHFHKYQMIFVLRFCFVCFP